MKLIIALLGCASACAQCPTGYVSIMDTIYTPAVSAGSTPAIFTGKATISAPTIPTSTNTLTFGRDAQTITVTNGAFSVCLAPNTAMNQHGTFYSVTFQSPVTHWSETWVVPASSGALKISQVRGRVVATNETIKPSDLSTYAATANTCIRFDGSQPIWANCPRSWSQLPGSWSSLTGPWFIQ